MNERLRALLARKQKAIDAAQAISAKANKEGGRDLTAEERAQFDAHLNEVEVLKGDIHREEALIEAQRNAPALGTRTDLHPDRVAQDPRRGFGSYGDFCMAVLNAGRGVALDERLQAIHAAAPATFGNEAAGADGGWLVPPEYSQALFDLALGDDSLVPMSDSYPVQGNSMAFPTDEGTPWGTSGVRAFWEVEGAAAAPQKPKVDGPLQLRLSKLMALVPITDELAADAVALDRWVGRKSAESIRWKTNLAFFQGNGVGQPLGFFQHASSVQQAKEGGQAAATVNTANVSKMFGRVLGRQNSVWMINDDVLQQVMQLTLGNQPIWTPPSAGFKDAPTGFLLGRPIMVTQLCKSLGAAGDINLVNWKAYRSITKAGAGIETATSMHLYFDAGVQAFRATFRIDGKPSLRAAVNPANGANTLAPFVYLEAR